MSSCRSARRELGARARLRNAVDILRLVRGPSRGQSLAVSGKRTWARLWAVLVGVALLSLPSEVRPQSGNESWAGVKEADRLSEPWWAERHGTILRAAKEHPDAELLLIGDSITNNYDKAKLPDENFQPTWKTFYEPRPALNLGFSGDTTANVLWRLNHGEVEGLHPKAAVVLIGTNDTGVARRTAAQTEAGIDAVVADLERRLPGTRILLMGILPSGVLAEKSARDAEINRYLSAVYTGNPVVTYLDVSSVFMKAGVLDSAVFYDPRLSWHPGPLHPDTVGQRRMAEAIEPTLARLMNEEPTVPLAAMTDINTALIPVEKLEVDSYDWYARHQAVLLAKRRMTPDVVMLGDSITHFWAGEPYGARASGPEAWKAAFGTRPVLNLGFGWDRIQNVLWRIDHGEIDGLRPAAFVVNIGTNNLTGTEHARASSPQEVAEGIEVLCAELQRRSPGSRIILMGIFPRGRRASDPLRAPIREVNALLAKRFEGRPDVTFLDLQAQLLKTDGELPAALMPDGTHPSEAGYQIWAEALRRVLPGTETAAGR